MLMATGEAALAVERAEKTAVWSCACPVNVLVHFATELTATCTECESPFRRNPTDSVAE